MACVQDALVELTKRELTQILGALKQHLPQQIRAHNYILNYLIHFDELNKQRHAIISPRWNMRFYGPRDGKRENCTFVSITDTEDYCITVFTLEECGQELAACLEQTKLIDWEHRPFALGVDEAHFNVINNIARTKCNNWTYEPVEHVMYIPKERVQKIDSPSIPPEMCLRVLHASQAHMINENWAHKYARSYELIRNSIELNGGIALLQRDSPRQAVAWTATNDFFTPGFLHTIPSERRKGYGSLVFIYELKRLVKRYNSDLFTFVVCSNIASIKLHRQIGFTPVNCVRWIVK